MFGEEDLEGTWERSRKHRVREENGSGCLKGRLKGGTEGGGNGGRGERIVIVGTEESRFYSG